jgi:hypothetical protein
MQTRAGTSLTSADHVLAIAGLLVLIVALWAPFGLPVGPTFEEWKGLYWTAERGGLPVVFPNRPILFAPYALAHLTGRPLEALNLMQASAMLAKGALVYLLVVRLLPGSGALAFFAGALTIVYPADTGFFTLRTVSQHLAVALCLLAIHLLLSLWRRFQWWRLLAVWIVQAMSLSMHAVSIPLLLASPVLLVWQERRLTRRLLLTWAAVAVVPLAFAAVTLAYGLRDDTYEGRNLAHSGLGPGFLAAGLQILGRMLAAYARHFSGGWIDALRELSPGADAALAITGAALVVGPALWWLARRGPAPRSAQEVRPYIELALLALLAMPVGFLLFLPTSWLERSWRVFYHSSAAAAVVVTGLCGLIAAAAGRWRRLVLAGLGGCLVALGLTAGLAQHRTYAEWGQGQQRILLGMVQAAPRLQLETALLLIDVPPYPAVRYWRVCGLVTECVELSLRYVYGLKDLEAAFCAPGETPRRAASETCRFERDHVVVEYRDPRGSDRRIVRRYPYQRLLVFETSEGRAHLLTDLDRYRAPGVGAAYTPGARIEQAPLPRLARAMLRP